MGKTRLKDEIKNLDREMKIYAFVDGILIILTTLAIYFDAYSAAVFLFMFYLSTLVEWKNKADAKISLVERLYYGGE